MGRSELLNGYTHVEDELGRPIQASGKLRLDDSVARNAYNQRVAGGVDRLDNDQGGHLIANMFGGTSDKINVVAFDKDLNKSEYLKIENLWKSAVKDGKTVEVDIKVLYPNKESLRPSYFDVKYKIDGEKFTKLFKN